MPANMDLRVDKAKENSAIRQSIWQPTLMRTRDKLVLYHAKRKQYGQHSDTRDDMLVMLGWQWDNVNKYFYTELTKENLDEVLEHWTRYGRLGINVSKGVREWQSQNS